MKIKVCGMTNIDQLHQLGELGVDFAGLIFYPESGRYVFAHGLTGADVKNAKIKPCKVGVFVNASYEEVMKRVDDFGLDMVQLHGHETPEDCSRISGHVDVVKAFRFSESDDVNRMIKDYYETAGMFLFDTGIKTAKENAGNLYGGTGRKFNWDKLKGMNIGKPFFLSGGIEPGDADIVKEFMKNPVAKDLSVVDINSRFETSPGIKDMKKVGQFVKELKS